MKTVVSKHVSPENFKAYGKVILLHDGLQPDSHSDTQTYYGQLAIMACAGPIQLGICVSKRRAFVVEEMEQHVKTPELLAALKGDFVTPVTTSITVDGKLYPDMDKLVALRVHEGEAIMFDEGIWHYSPFPISPECNILVGFLKDTPQNDFTAHRIDDKIIIE